MHCRPCIHKQPTRFVWEKRLLTCPAYGHVLRFSAPIGHTYLNLN
jgi:hypothetical protein